MAVDITRFVSIISSEYGMIVENQGYEFNACTIYNEKITQEVAVSSNSQVINLIYILSVEGEVLGVDSASTSGVKLET